MSKSYQEQILQKYDAWESDETETLTFPETSLTIVTRDCWTIARLEKEIELCSNKSSFGERTLLIDLNSEIAAILNKYGIKP